MILSISTGICIKVKREYKTESPSVCIERKLAYTVPVEIILVVLHFVENLVYRVVPLQSHVEWPVFLISVP